MRSKVPGASCGFPPTEDTSLEKEPKLRKTGYEKWGANYIFFNMLEVILNFP